MSLSTFKLLFFYEINYNIIPYYIQLPELKALVSGR